MGCYSLYKIIKDLLITLLGGLKNFRKLTIIIILSIVILFIYNNNCKAVVVDTGYPELPQIDIPEDYFNHKFLITYYYSSQEGNKLAIYVNDNTFAISSLVYNSTYRFYRRTFTPATGYIKSVSISNVPTNQVQNYINNNATLGTSTTEASWVSPTSTNNTYFRLNNFDLSFEGYIYLANAENFVRPSFYNKSEFLNLTSNSLLIYPNDYGTSDTLYLHILEENANINDGTNDIYYYSNRIIALNDNSSYYDVISSNNEDISYYNVPLSVFNFQPGKNYVVFINDNPDNINNTVGEYDFSSDYDGFYFSPTNEQISDTGVIINNQDNFYNNFNSSDYDENSIDSTLAGLSDATSIIDNSSYVGFFTTLFNKFEQVIDYDITDVENLTLPVPHSTENIVIPSNLVYDRIYNTTIYQFIYIFWYFVFGLYIFKFSNNLIIAIKSGELLKGWKSNSEVITVEIL